MKYIVDDVGDFASLKDLLAWVSRNVSPRARKVREFYCYAVGTWTFLGVTYGYEPWIEFRVLAAGGKISVEARSEEWPTLLRDVIEPIASDATGAKLRSVWDLRNPQV